VDFDRVFDLESGLKVFYRENSVSTMLDSDYLLSAGVRPPFVAVAGHQSGGRGRRPGRVWLDNPGDSLLCTIVPGEVSFEQGLFSLAAGAAVVQALVDSGVEDVSISWPNDILIGGKKVCGILCEVQQGFAAAGIGLNLGQEFFPEELRKPACSLFSVTGRKFEPEVILDRVFSRLTALNSSEILEVVNNFLYKKENKVEFLAGDPSGGNRVSGVLKGVTSSGAVVLDIDGKNQEFGAGEFIFL
jgi:BirA family biotin operon repressor/biotin-[acetyl-CoA-carboxylase] ligase